ncbi:uncharacterized protein LOC143608052 [Bidens hawaiensis]|uniref:uncharacterized protein LOC143608052 n=1 Tax=Bidens hawaiensis TaxID=980011 RepID=UPI00404ACF11
MVPALRTLTNMSKSMDYVIQRAEKQQPNNIMKLLKESSGFEGVGKYDVHQVMEEKYVDCWSLPIVNLTTIAISLPEIQKDIVERLLRSVSEGLTYVRHVEETLNTSDEYVIIQKATETLWLEVEIYQRWLGNKLLKPAQQFNTPKEIVQWFSDIANNMVTKAESKNKESSAICMSAFANSMYRITQTILISHRANIDEASQKELFGQLSSMISCILAACLANLPQVITTKCHTSVIEKREASVHTVAQLLGETMHIMNSLQDRQLPSLNHDELPFIVKWWACFLQPSP